MKVLPRFYTVFLGLVSPAMAQVLQLQPSDLDNEQDFGSSVAVDGGFLLVGSDRDDDNGSASGSAYLFKVPTGPVEVGDELIKFTASNGKAGDHFGHSVALQGGLALIGTPESHALGNDSGCAYLFDADPLSPTFGAQLISLEPSGGAAGHAIGCSVALDSGLALLGAQGNGTGNKGAAYLLDADPASPTFGQQLVKLLASDGAHGDNLGGSVSMADGLALVGAPHATIGADRKGAAYLFDVDPSSPTFGTQLAKYVAWNGALDDRFGWSVSLNEGRALVGAPYHDRQDFSWTDRDGAAYLYDADPSSAGFGTMLTEFLPAHTYPHHWHLGYSVSLQGRFAALGAPYEDVHTGTGWPHPWKAGAAYVFDADPSSPEFSQPHAKFNDPSPRVVAHFGSSICIQDGIVVIGTPDDSGRDWWEYRAGTAHVTRLSGYR